MTGILVQSKYNYRAKVAKALSEGNMKYVRMLIKKGKVIILDDIEKHVKVVSFDCPYAKK